MTREGECKILLKAAMEDWGSTSDPDVELTEFFNFKKILVSILSTPSLVNKIHQDKPWPVHLLDLMRPQEPVSYTHLTLPTICSV